MLRQKHVIQWHCISGYSGTSASLLSNRKCGIQWLTRKINHNLYEGGIVISVALDHRLSSLSKTKGYPQDIFYYLTLILMIYFYLLAS